MQSALSDERTGAAGPRQRCYSRVRVPQDYDCISLYPIQDRDQTWKEDSSCYFQQEEGKPGLALRGSVAPLLSLRKRTIETAAGFEAVSTFAGRWCCVASATDTYDR
jgi:hypothetical protein